MKPDKVPEEYRPEYLSHPMVTRCIDPILKFEDPKTAGDGLLTQAKADAESPLMIPFLYRHGERGHGSLPPVYFQVCGLDPLRDEALIYERILREEYGIKTKLDIYPGLGHYFWTNWPHLEKSRTFVEDTVQGMRWLLGC